MAALTGMVPVIEPVDVLRLRPGGREPPVRPNTSGEIPPEVDRPDDTAPTVMPLITVDTIAIAAALFAATVPTNDLDWVCEDASVTVSVNVYGAPPLANAGVPLRAPVDGLMVMPVGNAPPVMVNA